MKYRDLLPANSSVKARGLESLLNGEEFEIVKIMLFGLPAESNGKRPLLSRKRVRRRGLIGLIICVEILTWSLAGGNQIPHKGDHGLPTLRRYFTSPSQDRDSALQGEYGAFVSFLHHLLEFGEL